MGEFLFNHPSLVIIILFVEIAFFLYGRYRYKRMSEELSKVSQSLSQRLQHVSSRERELDSEEARLTQPVTDRNLKRRAKALKSKEDAFAKKMSEFDSLVESRLLARACKAASRPFFADTMVFKHMSENHLDASDSRLLRALSEKAVLSYPFELKTRIQGNDGVYDVSLNSCTCTDFRTHHAPCKHIYRLALEVGVLLSVSDEDKRKFIQSFENEKVAAEAAIRESQKTCARAKRQADCLQRKTHDLKRIIEESSQSAPWLAKQFADYDALFEKKLENEYAPRHAGKAADERKRIITEKQALTRSNKLLEYQLNFYEQLFPWLSDFKEVSVQDAANYVNSSDLIEDEAAEKDLLRPWLSPSEYALLSDCKKYQLALDRYNTHSKSKWEVGIKYERYVGYRLELSGYRVEYVGARAGKEDMGRDLIAKRNDELLIIQCKRYSRSHPVRENTVFQLYGSCVQYSISNSNIPVTACIYTTSYLSDEAKACAIHLKIRIIENDTFSAPYPLVKCNISKNGDKIYHLPFDQQYDSVIIEPSKGECYASTIAEAESKGFRRAFRWHGST